MQSRDEALAKLARSRFRSRFHLDKDDRIYIKEKGLDAVEEHARQFVKLRLAPAYIPNDGKQTPMRGHPVFKAQHGCACCCRECLNKWYKVEKNVELTAAQQEKIVGLLMAWINKELKERKMEE